MTGRRAALAVIAAAGVAALSNSATADMGKSPAGPGGYVLSFEGGFLHHDGLGVTGHGISDVLIDPDLGGPVTDVTVEPEDGYFLAGLIGYDNGTPFLFGFHRVELSFLYGDTDDSTSDTVPPNADIVLSTVNGEVLGVGGIAGRTTVERKTWEAALRFEDDDVVNASTTVTWVLAPFIRDFREESLTLIESLVPCCEFGRTSKVDSTLYGIFVAAEPETWISSNLALVGRIGAGIYGFDADGKFLSASDYDTTTDDFFAQLKDGSSGVGFRGLLGIGLKLKLAPSTLLEGFAEADYFSDMPTAHLTSNLTTGGYVSHVEDDDLWELRTGLRLTVGLGPGAN